MGKNDAKLLILSTGELKHKTDLENCVKSSYCLGNSLWAMLVHNLEKNLMRPFGFFGRPLALNYKKIFSNCNSSYSSPSKSDFKSNTCIVPVSDVEIIFSSSKLKLRENI